MRLQDGICPFGLCDGSSIVVDEATRAARPCRCRAVRVAQARGRALSGAIPRRYRDVSFESTAMHDIAARAPAVVRTVRGFVEDIDARLDAGRGLWLFGTTGTGKTELAMLVSRAAIDARRSVAVYTLPRLLAEIRSTYDDSNDHTYLDLLDRLAEVDLLHVDDVGAEQTSPWVLEQLYAIVNARYEEERSIVITTNLERDALAEQITERTVSRLEQMCEVLPLFGQDARQQRYEPAEPALERPTGPTPAPGGYEPELPDLAGLDDEALRIWR